MMLIKPLADPPLHPVWKHLHSLNIVIDRIHITAEMLIKRISAGLRQRLTLKEGGSDPALSGCLRSLLHKAPDQDLILCYCWKFIFSLMWKQQNQQWQFNFPRPTTVQPLLSLNHTHLLISVSTHPRKVGARSSLHSISLTLAWLPVRHFNLISFPKLEAVLIVKKSRTGEC